MCDHPNREAAMPVVADGVWCDPCLAPIVAALNAGGVATVASCCGHGRRLGSITLTDGRWLVIAPDVDAATQLANQATPIAGVDFPADQEQAADELSRLGQQLADGPNPLVRACCDMHNQHCEPPADLCCGSCTEARHPLHPPRERCVLDAANPLVRETPIRVNHDACRIMWGPGCTSYHGGHECLHGDGHDGKHTCPCGATADNGAQTGGEGDG